MPTTRRRSLLTSLTSSVALTATGLLAACGASASGGNGAAAGGASTAAPATLKAGATLAYWNDMKAPYPTLMQQWADDFSQKTGVKVEVSTTQSDDKLTAAFAGGTPPDIFRYHQDSMPIESASARNLLLGLDTYVKRDKYDLADFRKDAIAIYRWKGKLYALPRDYGLQLIFYNTDLFQKEGLPPIPADWNDKSWTFAKFLDACQRLNKPGDHYALFVPRGDRLWGSFVYSNGGAMVKKDQDGRATEIALAEKPATDALQLMQDLMYKHKVAPVPAEEPTLGTTQALFQMGKLAMVIANPGQNSQYKPLGIPYDVGVFPLGGAARRGVGGGGTGWAVSGPTKNPEEAWAFVSAITSRDGEMAEVKINQTTPSRISVSTSAEYLAPPPAHARAFADGQDFVVADPMHPRWPDVARDVVAKTFDEQLWSGAKPAAQIAQAIKAQADPLLKQ